jgi:hypothetical protein
MGNYSLSEVIKRWEHGTLTVEQTIGQVLLLVQDLSDRVGTVEKAVEKHRNDKAKPDTHNTEGG